MSLSAMVHVSTSSRVEAIPLEGFVAVYVDECCLSIRSSADAKRILLAVCDAVYTLQKRESAEAKAVAPIQPEASEVGAGFFSTVRESMA
jgi:hypothetical protein